MNIKKMLLSSRKLVLIHNNDGSAYKSKAIISKIKMPHTFVLIKVINQFSGITGKSRADMVLIKSILRP